MPTAVPVPCELRITKARSPARLKGSYESHEECEAVILQPSGLHDAHRRQRILERDVVAPYCGRMLVAAQTRCRDGRSARSGVRQPVTHLRDSICSRAGPTWVRKGPDHTVLPSG